MFLLLHHVLDTSCITSNPGHRPGHSSKNLHVLCLEKKMIRNNKKGIRYSYCFVKYPQHIRLASVDVHDDLSIHTYPQICQSIIIVHTELNMSPY